ncbi:hypothetical protein CLOM_g19635, partial [Closterium sp. NIES-68]
MRLRRAGCPASGTSADASGASADAGAHDTSPPGGRGGNRRRQPRGAEGAEGAERMQRAFFELHALRLGTDKATYGDTLEWLLTAAKPAIEQLKTGTGGAAGGGAHSGGS